MSEPRTVTLQILRHGPPHNQLLSPLTQYLALCGNHPAVTVHVPFEHKHMVTRLRAFSYQDSDETRQLQLKETAETMGNFLAQIPGLIAELAGGATGPPDQRSFTHLRLILSASELALLPVEMATAPNGFPAAGQHLSLQAQAPLCITREVRRDADDNISWMDHGSDPRILFIAAAPPQVGQIPFDSHLLILRKVVEPWVRYDNTGSATADIANHLVVLPQANVDQIERECARRSFTHIHILAHGVPVREAGDERTGLALHDSRDPSRLDIVNGQRLAALLRPADLGGQARPPCVVTLAVCDSGNVGTVEGSGGSVAHALHEAGIPLVVGSQFPLSFEASILIAQIHEKLLWGDDPRKLLLALRQQLYTNTTKTDPNTNEVKSTHDWASLVTYASLPADLGDRVPVVQFKQSHRSIQAAFNQFDGLVLDHLDVAQKDRSPVAAEKLEHTRRRIEAAKERLNQVSGSSTQQRPLIEGLLASTEKRLGENYFWAGDEFRDQSMKCLREASSHYERVFEVDRGASWAVVQRLVLDAVLGLPVDQVDWSAAWYINSKDLAHPDTKRVAWATGSLIELCLLAQLSPKLATHLTEQERDATTYARRLNDSPETGEIYYTRRQIRRYCAWFATLHPDDKAWANVSKAAGAAAQQLRRADEFMRPAGGYAVKRKPRSASSSKGSKS